jgi:hypothetical protein
MPSNLLPVLRSLVAAVHTVGGLELSISGAALCGRRNSWCLLSLASLVLAAILTLLLSARLHRVAHIALIVFMTRLGSYPAAISALTDVDALGRLCVACTATELLSSISLQSVALGEKPARGSSFLHGSGPHRSPPLSKLRPPPFLQRH